ncbi:hypothetical protein IFM89_034726 [Coptis chinensis]|uniref:Mitochondrial import inner membrane translocase subunit TIM50 n=1 Tax=Coptis chinensis TaxID=261450 RepID=A0A835LGJ4_9MAGN|nr:hypothetical protein IFM89_034726 [Coptis chinensis]
MSKPNRILLILDLNGVLVHIANKLELPLRFEADTFILGKAIIRKPFCDDFIKFCFERFYVGVWSSRKKLNLVRLLDFIMPERRYQLAFCWDQSHCTTTELHTVDNIDKPVMLKEFIKLWDKDDPNLPWERREYNESNTVMLDDSSYKALFNSAHTAIFPTSYDFQNENDNSLGPRGDIRMYLEGLTISKNVQKYIEQHPFGQQALTESDPSWPHYLQLINSRLHAPSDPGL